MCASGLWSHLSPCTEPALSARALRSKHCAPPLPERRSPQVAEVVERYQEAAEAETRSNGQLCSAELDSLRASAQLHKVPPSPSTPESLHPPWRQLSGK